MKYEPLNKPWLNENNTITMWEDGKPAGTHRVCLVDLIRQNPWFIEKYANIYGTTRLIPDKVWVILQLLKQLPPGVLVEVGVFRGGLIKLLADTIPDQEIHAYDTFSGVPKEALSIDDPPQPPGWFSNVDFNAVQEFVGHKKRVHYHQGIFPNTWFAQPLVVPIAFVHIDVNNYLTTFGALSRLYPLVINNGIIVIDDYGAPYCTGVAKAVDEFNNWIGKFVYQFVLHQAVIIKRGV